MIQILLYILGGILGWIFYMTVAIFVGVWFQETPGYIRIPAMILWPVTLALIALFVILIGIPVCLVVLIGFGCASKD